MNNLNDLNPTKEENKENLISSLLEKKFSNKQELEGGVAGCRFDACSMDPCCDGGSACSLDICRAPY